MRSSRPTTAARFKISAALIGSLVLVPALAACTGDNGEATGKSLPSAFPTSVPLVGGEIVSAAKMGGTGWSASVDVKDKAALDRVVADLVKAGFTVHGSYEKDPAQRSYSLADDKTSIAVVLTNKGKDFRVDYSIAPIKR